MSTLHHFYLRPRKQIASARHERSYNRRSPTQRQLIIFRVIQIFADAPIGFIPNKLSPFLHSKITGQAAASSINGSSGLTNQTSAMLPLQVSR